MKTHAMHLDREPFESIRRGEKTFELRLYDEKRRRIRPGDMIEFTNGETGEKLIKRVLSVRVFPSFDELYEQLPLEKCGYAGEALKLASPRDMEEYYSPELIRKYGAAAIELGEPA